MKLPALGQPGQGLADAGQPWTGQGSTRLPKCVGLGPSGQGPRVRGQKQAICELSQGTKESRPTASVCAGILCSFIYFQSRKVDLQRSF